MKYCINITPQPALRPRLSKYGTYNPPKYKKYKNDLIFLLKQMKIPKGEYYRIDAIFYFPYPKSVSQKKRINNYRHQKKPDLSNIFKSFEDAIEQAGIINNDSQICVGVMEKKYTTSKIGRIEFLLY